MDRIYVMHVRWHCCYLSLLHLPDRCLMFWCALFVLVNVFPPSYSSKCCLLLALPWHTYLHLNRLCWLLGTWDSITYFARSLDKVFFYKQSDWYILKLQSSLSYYYSPLSLSFSSILKYRNSFLVVPNKENYFVTSKCTLWRKGFVLLSCHVL